MAVTRNSEPSLARQALSHRTEEWVEQYGSFDAIPLDVLKRYYKVRNTKHGRTAVPRSDEEIVAAMIEDAQKKKLHELIGTPQSARENGHAEENRTELLKALTSYLEHAAQNGGKRILFSDRTAVMDDVKSWLEEDRYGYISLPTGYGKIYIIAELAAAVDKMLKEHPEKKMKIVVLSPTQLILEQNEGKMAQSLSADSVGVYYGYRKENLGANIINTTPHSFLNMLMSGAVNPDEVGIIVGDELHKMLGEQRHRIFRALPNAVGIGLTSTPFFEQLHGYEERKLIDWNEPWVGMFKNKIHELELEEAIASKILVPAQVHVIKTDNVVGTVRITKGDYDEKQIERYLNNQARNYLAVGMLAGLDAIPKNIKLTPEQAQEVQAIHEKIKGKNTALFGISINHIEELSDMIKAAGVDCVVVHGDLSPEERIRRFKAYEEGPVKVLLGVDMIREGWDYPPTEVGIMLGPTYSGVVAMQRFGRILRQSPETGKEFAIAIEIVDRYNSTRELPILIRNLFNHHYFLRGSQNGKEKKITVPSPSGEKPIVEFFGMNIDSVFEEAMSKDLISGGFKGATIHDINKWIDSFSKEVRLLNPNADVIEFYTNFVNRLPQRISSEAQDVALTALASLDTNTARAGFSAVIMLNMGTILAGAKRYMGSDRGENEEMLGSAIASVTESLLSLGSGKFSIKQEIYMAATKGAMDYIAVREGVNRSYIESGALAIERQIAQGRRGYMTDGKSLRQTAEEIAMETGAAYSTTYHRLRSRFSERYEERYPPINDIEEAAMQGSLREDMNEALKMLPKRERMMLEMRFGLDYKWPRTAEEAGGDPKDFIEPVRPGDVKTFEEVGQAFNLTRERIRKIEAEQLAALRWNMTSVSLLKTYAEGAGEDQLAPEWQKPVRSILEETAIESEHAVLLRKVEGYLNREKPITLEGRAAAAKIYLNIRDEMRQKGAGDAAGKLYDMAIETLMDPLINPLRQTSSELYDKDFRGIRFDEVVRTYQGRFNEMLSTMSTLYDAAQSFGIQNLETAYVSPVLKKFTGLAMSHSPRSVGRIYLLGMASEFAKAFDMEEDAEKFKQKALKEISTDAKREE